MAERFSLAGRALRFLNAAVPSQVNSLPAADLALVLLAAGEGSPTLVATVFPVLTARQEANGGFDGGDIRGTALAIQALRASLPDLTLVPSPNVLQPSAVIDQPFQFDFVVLNIGRIESAATVVSAVIEGPAGVVRFNGSIAVPPIAAGGSVT